MRLSGMSTRTVRAKIMTPDEIEGRYPIVLLAVKARHTLDALPAVASVLEVDGCVVSLQNGLEEYKIAKAVVRILGGKALSLLSPVERDRFRGYLLAALGDDDEDVQDAAVSGLGSVGGEDAAKTVLAHAARLDREPVRTEVPIICEVPLVVEYYSR